MNNPLKPDPLVEEIMKYSTTTIIIFNMNTFKCISDINTSLTQKQVCKHRFKMTNRQIYNSSRTSIKQAPLSSNCTKWVSDIVHSGYHT